MRLLYSEDCTDTVRESALKVDSGRTNKSETELTASVPEKRSKTHKELKERFFSRRNRTKRANFRGSLLFQATYNIKTDKQTINSTYLVSVGCGRLPEGKKHLRALNACAVDRTLQSEN